MTVESPYTVAEAPEFTAQAVCEIITKISPFAFDSGLDVILSAEFADFLEKVSFAIEFTDETQVVSDAEPFLAVVRAHQDILASRLAEARDAARATRLDTLVSLDGIAMDPTWPLLVLSAGPYNPDEDTEDEDDR